LFDSGHSNEFPLVFPRKQMEARHSKAMEAAEEKFRKAFDRVKRAAVEAPWKQEILALSWWY